MDRCDIIITTGGLGPTADDITKEACCEALGVELEMDMESLESIRRYFARKAVPMPEANEKQALREEHAATNFAPMTLLPPGTNQLSLRFCGSSSLSDDDIHSTFHFPLNRNQLKSAIPSTPASRVVKLNKANRLAVQGNPNPIFSTSPRGEKSPPSKL